MIPLYHYQHKHPHNFVFLGLFTLCLSFSIGVACANTQGKIVLEALILTSAVDCGCLFDWIYFLPFWASKKGKEFGYVGPFLFSGLILLVLKSFIQNTSSRVDAASQSGDPDSLVEMNAAAESLEAKEKQKSSFELSGKLAEETNRVAGVNLLYSEPPEAHKSDNRWRLYVFKGGEALNE